MEDESCPIASPHPPRFTYFRRLPIERDEYQRADLRRTVRGNNALHLAINHLCVIRLSATVIARGGERTNRAPTGFLIATGYRCFQPYAQLKYCESLVRQSQ